MATELFQVNLTNSQKSGLLRRAALLTAERGRRITMSDLLRDAIDGILTAPLDDGGPAGSSKTTIRYTPRPDVAKALKRASAHSGKPVPEVIDTLVAEALEMEAA